MRPSEIRGAREAIRPVQHQTNATLNQVAVQNTWYTVLDTTNARLIYSTMAIAVANETLEMRITIDGQVLTASQAAVFGTTYYGSILPWGLLGFSATPTLTGLNVHLEGRIVKVEVRKTTATGANALTSCVVYAKW